MYKNLIWTVNTFTTYWWIARIEAAIRAHSSFYILYMSSSLTVCVCENVRDCILRYECIRVYTYIICWIIIAVERFNLIQRSRSYNWCVWIQWLKTILNRYWVAWDIPKRSVTIYCSSVLNKKFERHKKVRLFFRWILKRFFW